MPSLSFFALLHLLALLILVNTQAASLRRAGMPSRAVFLALPLLWVNTQAANLQCADMPRRAVISTINTENDCLAWSCTGGTFRVSNGRVSRGACKACTPRACEVGQTLSPCTAEADATCQSCGQLSQPSVMRYMGNQSCLQQTCINGFFSILSMSAGVQCVLCPAGTYCEQGFQRVCADGDTTYANGKQSKFDCQPNATSTLKKNIMISVQYTGGADNAVYDSVSLANILAAYMTYTSLESCSFTTAAVAGAGTFTCYATIGQSVAGAYIIWLQQQLLASSVSLRSVFASRLLVNMQNIVVQPTPVSDKIQDITDLTLLRAGPAPMLEAPERRRWGSSQEDLFQTLMAVVCILFFSGAMCVLGVVVCASRWRHGRSVHSIMQDVNKYHKQMLAFENH